MVYRTNLAAVCAPNAGCARPGKRPNYRDPLVISVARDGLHFDRHWVVRTTQLPPTPGGVGGDPSELKCKWPGHQHRSWGCRPGFQYPAAMWREATGEMVVAYSVNKEDIAITRFPLRLLAD